MQTTAFGQHDRCRCKANCGQPENPVNLKNKVNWQHHYTTYLFNSWLLKPTGHPNTATISYAIFDTKGRLKSVLIEFDSTLISGPCHHLG
jgi:hypothetical protein